MTTDSPVAISDPKALEARRIHERLRSAPTPEGVATLRMLAAQGSASAMRLLGWAYLDGTGIAVDVGLAEYWLRQSAAQGDPLGRFDLGQLYLRQKDYAQARAAFSPGVDAGHARSLEMLQWIDTQQRYEAEPDTARLNRAYETLKTDPGTVLAELRDLVQLGSTGAMVQLGLACADGRGMTVDEAAAIAWFQRAHDAGSRYAAYYLGDFYVRRHDYAQARAAFAAGAARDFAPAQRALGVLYRRGLGGKKDIHAARPLFKRAAALGNLFARCDCALLLLRGHDGIRRIPEGFRLYRSAVDVLTRAYIQNSAAEQVWAPMPLLYHHRFWRARRRAPRTQGRDDPPKS